MVMLMRLLLSGYALAALAAGAAGVAGAAVWVVALVFWIGGALAVAGLAVLAAALAPARAEPRTDAAAEDEDALVAAALEAWERDRLGDRPAAAVGVRDVS